MATTVQMGRDKLGRVPVNITLPRNLFDEVKPRTKADGITLSSLIETLLRQHYELPLRPAVLPSKPTKRKGAK